MNILRLEASLWMLPDDPLDLSKWFNLNQSTWSMVVKPSNVFADTSSAALVYSRFKTFHDLAKNIVADNELSIECRRYLDGDPPPWEGANLRHGCLVWEIVDKSARNTGTSFGGSVFTGLLHQFVQIGANGLDETLVTAPDPNVPEAYQRPGYLGTVPAAPWVIFREGDLTGIQSSEFSWKPATDVGVVAGGHSAPGVNEALGAAVQMIGDLTAMIPGVPPLGGAADALLKPLYSDVLLAFMKWKNPFRAQRLGWSHYHEKWAEGSDRAYTLSALVSLRSALWQTREVTRHTLVVADGCPYRIGQKGFGHFFLGDRVGSTVLGMPDEGLVFVDRVTELTLAWDRKSTPSWKVTVGQREPEDPVMKALAATQDLFAMTKELGLL